MELSMCFNGRCMAFIACVIGPRKIDLTYLQNLLYWWILQLHLWPSFSQRQSSHRWPNLVFQRVDFWLSIKPSQRKTAHWPLLHLVLWYRSPCGYFSPSYSTIARHLTSPHLPPTYPLIYATHDTFESGHKWLKTSKSSYLPGVFQFNGR